MSKRRNIFQDIGNALLMTPQEPTLPVYINPYTQPTRPDRLPRPNRTKTKKPKKPPKVENGATVSVKFPPYVLPSGPVHPPIIPPMVVPPPVVPVVSVVTPPIVPPHRIPGANYNQDQQTIQDEINKIEAPTPEPEPPIVDQVTEPEPPAIPENKIKAIISETLPNVYEKDLDQVDYQTLKKYLNNIKLDNKKGYNYVKLENQSNVAALLTQKTPI